MFISTWYSTDSSVGCGWRAFLVLPEFEKKGYWYGPDGRREKGLVVPAFTLANFLETTIDLPTAVRFRSYSPRDRWEALRQRILCPNGPASNLPARYKKVVVEALRYQCLNRRRSTVSDDVEMDDLDLEIPDSLKRLSTRAKKAADDSEPEEAPRKRRAKASAEETPAEEATTRKRRSKKAEEPAEEEAPRKRRAKVVAEEAPAEEATPRKKRAKKAADDDESEKAPRKKRAKKAADDESEEAPQKKKTPAPGTPFAKGDGYKGHRKGSRKERAHQIFDSVFKVSLKGDDLKAAKQSYIDQVTSLGLGAVTAKTSFYSFARKTRAAAAAKKEAKKAAAAS
jgi:hypothetical protein